MIDAILAPVEPLSDAAPAPAPGPPKSALAFFAVLLLLFLPGIVAQGALLPAGLLWTELFAFLLPAFIVAAGSNLRPASYLRLGRARVGSIVLGAAVGGAGYLFAGSIMALVQRLLPESWVRAFDAAQLFAGPAWERVLLVFAAVAVAPVCEEIAFRGYVQTTLAVRRGPAAAIAGSALLFAALHLDPVRFPALVVLGAVFGWLTWRAGSVWPAVAAHAANNAVTSALVLAVGPPEPGPAPLGAIAVTMAFGAVALLLLLRAYRVTTPLPPPPGEAVVLRDPADPSLRFSAARVPRVLRGAAVLGAVLFLALLSAAALAGKRPGRGVAVPDGAAGAVARPPRPLAGA